MRKYIVAGNWKMNTTVPEGVELAKAVVEKGKDLPANVELVVAPPFTHLACVADVLKGSKVALSAQNCADHEKGAYTGEVAVNMLTSLGCQYTILGHSERRQYYGETDAKLVVKTKLALEAGLKVILCVGENLDEREAGKHFEVVTEQTKAVLYNFTAEDMKNIVIAYEPVWAIGTGKTATAEQAEEIHACIRTVIAEKFGLEVAEDMTILYGGSCKPSNANRRRRLESGRLRADRPFVLIQNPYHRTGLVSGAPQPDKAGAFVFLHPEKDALLAFHRVAAGGPEQVGGDLLAFLTGQLLAGEDEIARHVVVSGPELVQVAVEGQLAVAFCNVEDFLPLHHEADFVAGVHFRVHFHFLPAGAEEKEEDGGQENRLSHGTMMSLMMMSELSG